MPFLHCETLFKVETRSRKRERVSPLIIIRFSIPVLSLSAYACTPSGRERGFCTRLRLPRVRAALARVGEKMLPKRLELFTPAGFEL